MRDQVSSRGGRTGMPLRGVIIAVVAAALTVPSAPAAAEGHVETFVAFDPAAGEFPEDRRRQARQRLREPDPGQPDPSHRPKRRAVGRGRVRRSRPRPSGTGRERQGDDLRRSLEPEPRNGRPTQRPGVYRVLEDGTSERLPGTGAMLFPNDVTLDKRGNVYATDTSRGRCGASRHEVQQRSGRTIPCSRERRIRIRLPDRSQRDRFAPQHDHRGEH